MACALCALQVCANPKTNWRTIFVKVIDGALTATEESHSVTFAHCPSAPFDIPHLDIGQTCCEMNQMKDLQNPLFHRKLARNSIPKVIPDESRASHKSPRRHEDRHHRQHPQQCLRLHLSKPVIAGPETRWPKSFRHGNTADVSSFSLHRLCFFIGYR